MSPAEEAWRDYETFYASTARRLVTAVYALTGDLADAEDAVQEAFARAWQRWDKLSAEGDPAPWVRTVAVRLAVSTWRKARNRLRAQLRHGPPPAVPSLAPDHVALVAALRELPAEQRVAVVLHHVLDLPVAQVARETGVSEPAVRTRLSRARKALRGRLDDDRAPRRRPAFPTSPEGVSQP
ncbi:SigE family RNA polymerase sigma factor [Streptomyces litchfieldiae]|uniref:SigE family RNA polymerase sigma factor n=1 Tax=Streptomyces litchfieldiae TaxID=3075543 RepID=A0ABU2MUZ8_9ACTN|nr:SigE family RNA polymerase sigma factor [Streptomyces sp. DSM 44938]MDT0345222.1 SigE family RNA polymerase sigma factor [Streptomyces sp. DSM 44938]